MASNFIDEVNRLFDELVHEPWRRSLPASARQAPLAPASDWAVEIPLQDFDRGDVSVTTEGRRLTVTVLRKVARRATGSGEGRSTHAEDFFRQSFLLPEGAVMRAVEATFEDGMLRIRVGLRRR